MSCRAKVWWLMRNTGRALVYAERARNISISGGGELNANGRCRFKVNDPKGINKLYTSRPDNLYTACCEDIRSIRRAIHQPPPTGRLFRSPAAL